MNLVKSLGQIPNGIYDCVGIIDHGPDNNKNDTRLGQRTRFAVQSSMIWSQERGAGEESVSLWNKGTSQSEQGSVFLIQANVPDRPALSAYHWHATVEKTGSLWTTHWGQVHTGNQTDSKQRNHAPFYATVTSHGQISEDGLSEVQTDPKSSEIHYLEHQFNGQQFLDWDITDRFFGRDHMTRYSSKVDVSQENPNEGALAGKQLYCVKEYNGFKAPRMLLCGNVNAVMTYILQERKS